MSELLHWFRRSRAQPSARELADVGQPARHAGLTRVRRELSRLGIRAKIDFVWSGDGSGVEEEAPSIIHLHRPLLRAQGAPARVRAAAERALSLDLVDVARHEVGHALLFRRPRDAKTAAFRQLFGDVDVAYRVGNPVEEVLRRMRRHGGFANPRYRRVVSLYAATHPHERFAEAVRIALALGADERALSAWARSRGVARVVEDQLIWVARWLCAYER